MSYRVCNIYETTSLRSVYHVTVAVQTKKTLVVDNIAKVSAQSTYSLLLSECNQDVQHRLIRKLRIFEFELSHHIAEKL